MSISGRAGAIANNKIYRIEVTQKVHHMLKKLAFNTEIPLKRLASAILYEAIKNDKELSEIILKLKENPRYYEAKE